MAGRAAATQAPVIWQANEGSQKSFLRSPFFEVAIEGTRGSAKTDALLMSFAQHVGRGFGAGWRGIIFRREFKDLADVVAKSRRWFNQIFPGAVFLESASQYKWKWPSGEELLFRTIKRMDEYWGFHGQEYPFIGWEELVTWPGPELYDTMKSICRSSYPGMPRKYRSTFNPYGRGHHWVKQRFIDPAPRGKKIEDEFGPRICLHAHWSENPHLTDNDPGYIDRLRAATAGNDSMLRAWVEGDWEGIDAGSFFSAWRKSEVLCEPFEVPASWPLFGMMDYGEFSPTAHYLATVDWDGVVYFVGEYYQRDKAASQHAAAIAAHVKSHPLLGRRFPSQTFADPSMWVKRRLDEAKSESPADYFTAAGVYLTPANNDRINGWRLINNALVSKRFRVFDGWCPNLVRTLPALPRDEHDPDDVDTDAEDHAADAVRYGMMHFYKPRKIEVKPYVGTGNELIDQLKALRQKVGR